MTPNKPIRMKKTKGWVHKITSTGALYSIKVEPKQDKRMPKHNPKEVKRVLDEAYNLLAKPGAWCQGAYSRDKKGNSSMDDYYDNKAVSYCMSGAVSVACKKLKVSSPVQMAACDTVYNALPDNGVGGMIGYNDAKGRTQEEVLDILDHARNSL